MARILIIDDEEPFLRSLSIAVSKAGHVVMEASNGDEAARLFRANPADLVLTDIVMPGNDGLGFIMEVRRDFPTIPIVAMSGGITNSPLYLKLAERLGARKVFQKPFAVTELLKAIEDLLVKVRAKQ